MLNPYLFNSNSAAVKRKTNLNLKFSFLSKTI